MCLSPHGGLRGRGFTVNLLNLGLPTGVISRSFQDLGSPSRTIVGNFIDQEVPFVQRDTTLITIFAGANEVNIITSALGSGAGTSDPAVRRPVGAQFGDDSAAHERAGCRRRPPDSSSSMCQCRRDALPGRQSLSTSGRTASQPSR
jgi:hypothetical protein